MAFDLNDYVDVSERIRQFYDRYPDGSLRTLDWDIREVGDRLFVVYHAVAHRSPEDPIPAHGMAWEPFPGPTPYTKDSELMNAETAAWGRAIVASGISAKKIASKQEVKARQQQPSPPKEPSLSSDQIDQVWRTAGDAGVSPAGLADAVKKVVGMELLPWPTEDDADKWLLKNLPRLPARLLPQIVLLVETATS